MKNIWCLSWLLILPPITGFMGHQGPDDPAIVDVMVVYTPAAKTWAEQNEGSIEIVVAQAMETGQLVMDNSGTNVHLRLIHSSEVNYNGDATDETQSGNPDSIDHLNRLQDDNDGYMDAIHGWRDQYGADLVALFAKVEDTGGLGWVPNDWNDGNPDFGFSLTRVQQASWTFTHVHEMGHNMGTHHHKDQNTGPGPGIFNYSAGWHSWDPAESPSIEEVHVCTVMTYRHENYYSYIDSDAEDPESEDYLLTRIPYFSNPNVSYDGENIGETNGMDNALTIREMKHVIANYRHRGPAWWTHRGILSGNLPDDYGVVNQGQLKHVAVQAYHELEENLNNGADVEIENLVNSWDNPGSGVDDFQAINLGQLKNVASLFYDRLIDEGVVNEYPWASSQEPGDDFALANIGQLKNMFSFDLE